MKDYRPFEEPYGSLTKTSLIERSKAFLILFAGILVFAGGAIVTSIGLEHEILWFQIFCFVAGVISFAFSVPVIILSMIWIYFPQFKPDWRKKFL